MNTAQEQHYTVQLNKAGISVSLTFQASKPALASSFEHGSIDQERFDDLFDMAIDRISQQISRLNHQVLDAFVQSLSQSFDQLLHDQIELTREQNQPDVDYLTWLNASLDEKQNILNQQRAASVVVEQGI